MNGIFPAFALWTSRQAGRPPAFVFACVLVVGWGAVGPIFRFSDTWQLVMNTASSIVTFLMVFLLQNTQNRDSAAVHVKLDELIHVTHKARNKLIDLEDRSEDEIERERDELRQVRR